jgi:hypothetical protein
MTVYLRLLLLSVLVLSACQDKNNNKVSDLPAFGAPDSTATPSAPVKKKALPEPCALVSVAEAQVAVGQPMTLTSSDAKLCAYQSTGQAGDIASLMVNLSDNDDEAMAVDVFRALTGQSGKLNKMVNDQMGEKTQKSGRSLDGLGDEARLNSSNADMIGNTSLIVRKGSIVLNLSIIGMGSDPAAGERLEALARKIVVAL